MWGKAPRIRCSRVHQRISVVYVGYGEYRRHLDAAPDPNSEGVKELRARVSVAEAMVQIYQSGDSACQPRSVPRLSR